MYQGWKVPGLGPGLGDSEHIQHWITTAALKNDKRKHRVRGHAGLAILARKLNSLCSEVQLDELRRVA